MFLKLNKNHLESKSSSIAENGVEEIDKAFYVWAIKILNPKVHIEQIEQYFIELKNRYNQEGRYFHRGLGHPRSLFSKKTQKIYQDIRQNFKNDNLQTIIDILDKQISADDALREAQHILAAFYHDVVHRNDKKDIPLDSSPILFSMLDKKEENLRVEELSCIIAERALTNLKISNKCIIPILLAIIGTIPFSVYSQPENLLTRLMKVAKIYDCQFTQSEVDNVIEMALAVSFGDLSSYAEDDLDVFNKKTWGMMLERYEKLADEKHTLLDEANAIFKFYESDQKLLSNVEKSHMKIYETYDKSSDSIKKFIASQNAKAVTKIKEDLILQGIQLGSLAILITMLNKIDNKCVQQPIASAVKEKVINDLLSYPEHFSGQLSPKILQVLKNHNRTCRVNGVTIKRGSANAVYSQKLVGLFGVDSILEIANGVKIAEGHLSFPEGQIEKLLQSLNCSFSIMNQRK